MKNLILTMCLLLVVSFTYAQLHVVKSSKKSLNGAVGIDVDQPTEKLDVNGDLNVRGKQVDDETYRSFISVGKKRPIIGRAGINLFAEKSNLTTSFYSDLESGKYVSTFSHHGNGHFQLRTWDPNSDIRFITKKDSGPKVSMIIAPRTGNVGINMWEPQALLHVNGNSIFNQKVAIGTQVHDSNAILTVNGVAKKTGGGEFVTTSDKRTKKNINQYVAGLDDVLKLNPVTFNYNGKAGISDTEKNHVGLIAQEFAEVAPYAVEKFDFTEEGSNKTEEYMSIDASSVKYMLVNAVKEQQALIEAQKAALETLQTEVAELKANGASIGTPGASEMSVLLEGSGTESALLAQNSPNPFTTNTRIEYFIPTDSRHCRMSFRDMNGKELKEVQIENDGIGAIDLSAKDLAAGIYSYVLYVNGEIVASKKMILRQ